MKLFACNVPAGSLRLLLLLGALVFPHVSSATEIEVVRASAKFHDSRQFFRISEFFTRRENTGNQVIRRSQPEERGGFYLTVRLKEYPYYKDVEEALRFELILPGDVEPTLYTFSLGPEKRQNPTILVGVTGDDWPDPSALPLAWRVSFEDADGKVIAQTQSFLWGADAETAESGE